MSNFQEKLEKYADLVVKVGVNVQNWPDFSSECFN